MNTERGYLPSRSFPSISSIYFCPDIEIASVLARERGGEGASPLMTNHSPIYRTLTLSTISALDTLLNDTISKCLWGR